MIEEGHQVLEDEIQILGPVLFAMQSWLAVLVDDVHEESEID